MIDEIKLKIMGRPSAAEMVKPQMSERAKVAVRVALRRSNREQRKLLQKAARIK